MIVVEYTVNPVEGEPGPNFYWRGQPKDFLKLLVDLHPLGKDEDVDIVLNEFDYIKVADNLVILLNSVKGGSKLCVKSGNKIYMSIDSSIWIDILHKILGISFYKSHDYIEFDNLRLTETANVIISSEI